jgi:hypothetical protein
MTFIFFLISYYHTPWSEKLIVPQLVNKFVAFYADKRFRSSYTRYHNFTLSRIISIQSTPPIFFKSILIFSFHLRLGLPSYIFTSALPTKALHAPLLSIIRATCPAHFILLYLITTILFGEQYRS